MVTRRVVLKRPRHPKITQIAVNDYKIYCENDDAFHDCAEDAPYRECECCQEAYAAWERLYFRFGLKPWLPRLPAIHPDRDDDRAWAAALEQALQYLFANDKARIGRIPSQIGCYA
jgi:hypothetical protein